VIYANRALRAAVAAMRRALQELRDESAAPLEDKLTSLGDLEHLVGLSELLKW
jgi:hypothetical protein